MCVVCYVCDVCSMVFAVYGVVYVIQCVCVCVCSLCIVCSMMCMCGTKLQSNVFMYVVYVLWSVWCNVWYNIVMKYLTTNLVIF